MSTFPVKASSKTWDVNSVRYTLFPRENYNVDDEWWNKITGKPPDNINHNLKINARHYEGDFEGGLLIIDLIPTRIDINYIANKPNYPNQVGILSLGFIDDVLKVYLPMVHTFLNLENCPNAQRIAFGGVLFQKVDSKVTGYDTLREYLHNNIIDSINSRDFLFQINRPRISTVIKNLEINRLSKWSVMKFQTMITQPFSGLPSQSIVDGEYTVNLEMDVNSQGDYRYEISRDEQHTMIEEFVSLGREIALHGDIS